MSSATPAVDENLFLEQPADEPMTNSEPKTKTPQRVGKQDDMALPRFHISAAMKSVLLAALPMLLSCAEPCKLITAPTRHGASELSQITDEPRPRCTPREPACGPEPVEEAKPVCYRPSAERERLPLGEGRHSPSSAIRCTHDGECVIAGCGNACVGFRLAEIETNCIGYDWLGEDAFCGCVEGECSFFRQ